MRGHPVSSDGLADIRVEKLSSGVTVLLREARLAPVAEVQVWAGVGSADEGPGEAGLAHFHEHMLFKGTAPAAASTPSPPSTPPATT
jgi:predicted Zn-dependent peptidase